LSRTARRDDYKLLVALEVAKVFSGEALSLSLVSFYYSGYALLRRNLLRQLLTGYSAARLPASPSEAVSRFRDDVEGIVESTDAWNDLVGRIIFAGAALAIMLRLDAVVTVVIFVPLASIVPITQRLGHRLAARGAPALAAPPVEPAPAGRVGEVGCGVLYTSDVADGLTRV